MNRFVKPCKTLGLGDADISSHFLVCAHRIMEAFQSMRTSLVESIQILVPEEKMEATVWFYTDGLGLEEEKRTDGTRAFGIAGEQRVELVPQRGPLLRTRTKVRFHVHGIAECLRYLISSGHLPRAVASEPWSRPGEMDITDPAGNVITLLDADGPFPRAKL